MNKLKPTLSFRPTEEGDAPELTRWLIDPEVLKWFPMIDMREVEDAVRIWISFSKIGAGISVLADGVLCGMANLYIQPYEKLRHTCLFSIILNKEHRGLGIGAALLKELIKLAKEKFHIETLHLEVYQGNPAKKLYDRLGFKEFGRHPHFLKENGKYTQKIFMQKQL
jgi:RimJ/RimL family protein N-acetyltransferase